MTSLSSQALGLLHTLSAGGLVLSTLVALVCAVVVLRTGSEQDRRQAVLAAEAQASARAEAGQEGLSEAVRLRARLAEAEARAVTASERADALETRLAEAEVARLAAQVDALEAAPETPAVAQPAASREVRDLPPEAEEILRPAPTETIAQEQANTIVAELAPHAGDFSVEVTSAPGEGARLYAAQLAAALRGAGVETHGPYGVLTTLQGEGVFVSVEGAAAEPGGVVLSALQAAALPAQPGPANGTAADILAPEGADVRLYIGGVPRSAS